jgi:hypothetical protein
MKVKYNFILMLLNQMLCFSIEVSVIGVGGGKIVGKLSPSATPSGDNSFPQGEKDTL